MTTAYPISPFPRRLPVGRLRRDEEDFNRPPVSPKLKAVENI